MTFVERHESLVPMGCMVSSKGRHRNCRGLGPAWIDDGDGAYVSGDGEQYLDWSAGLGALTLGHGAGKHRLPMCLPLPTKLEAMLAEKLHEWIPCAEQVRLLKTGTDATSAAIRLARIVTGRDRIVDAGSYHGCADWSITSEHEGVPACVRALTTRVPFNDAAAVEAEIANGNVAAVILEPVSLVAPEPGYLEALREICTRHGVVLIFDEVITGIRMAKGGAQQVYGVTPDLCCIGKALANGHPISAVCGKREVMSAWSRTHLSGTHYGEPSAMSASLATMAELERRDFWAHQEQIGGQALAFARGMVERHGLNGHVSVQGHAHWWVVKIPDPIEQTLWQQMCICKGVLASNGSHFVTLAHSWPEVEKTADAYDHAFYVLKQAIEAGDVALRLACEPNVVTFRRN
jgi:glutamate-1-semialdehyde 2,1-aminomutase